MKRGTEREDPSSTDDNMTLPRQERICESRSLEQGEKAITSQLVAGMNQYEN